MDQDGIAKWSDELNGGIWAAPQPCSTSRAYDADSSASLQSHTITAARQGRDYVTTRVDDQLRP